MEPIKNNINEINKEIQNHIKKAKIRFSYFLEHIFPLSFPKIGMKKAPHTFKWADRIQNNKRTATLSARKHLKSTTMYAWVMWRLLRVQGFERGLYMSYTQPMSMYHTENIKRLIEDNPLFTGMKDLTGGATQIDYAYNGHRFMVEPAGIGKFNRGWHGAWVVCDDILQDPTSELLFTSIDKINRAFFEQVMSLPIEGGEIHLVGTAQHAQDLFFKILDLIDADIAADKPPSWDWAEYKAIHNEKNKEVLWPELFSYERLQELRREISDKAFNKEYMCSPVWSEDAYFKRDELMKVVDKHLKQETMNASKWKVRGYVMAGLDIGKKAHPSHLSIFLLENGHYTQLYEEFMYSWDYTKQVAHINGLIEFYRIDELRYDATRGELESFAEQNLIDNHIWIPIIFGSKNKFDMAGNFSKNVNNQTMKLLNAQKMLDSILSVNNKLQAPETDAGHGDAFWSVALALIQPGISQGYIAI